MAEFDPRAYWEARLDGDWSLRSAGWAGLSEPFQRWQYRARAGAVRAAAGDLSGLDVLEVGPGTGHWIPLWHELGAATVTGVDLTEAAVERLRKAFPADRFAQGDIAEGLPGGDEFDLVAAVDVLLHIVDDSAYARALANLRGATRAGGRLLAIDPVIAGSRLTADARHARARTLADVGRALGDSGWTLETVRPAVCLLNNPIEAPNRATGTLLRGLWLATRTLARWPATGAAVGAALYPADRLLCRRRTGPSSKVLVARAT